ncbi:hypothetical protein PUV54_16435 [Hyphococcus flavus]|uniref:Uncharacterized protein n=1 Tax=Hyphococcus flavus TaxID=1866326 RepID=A0AAF0CBP8_9PROT|nr:hypothetical protein [Hyphococcus flavus]WDI31540.1 hypothetical protein PUV54_16435 [Hyphococcus flavus]
MIKRALFITLLLLFPGGVFASETLPVRAGEHGEYSRLVIPDAPGDWRISTSDRKVEIALPSKDYEFELSDILEKRKAHRVLSARVVDGDATRSLVLTLTCDCPVRTSKGDSGSLVVDIFNNGPTALAPTQEDTPETDAMRQAAKQAPENAPSTPESMREARDRMIALLAEARHQGVVQLKIDEKRNESESENNGKPKPQPAVEPTQAAHTAPEFDPATASDTPLANEARLDPPALTASKSEAPQAECVDASLFDEPLSEEGKLDYSTIAKLRHRLAASTDPSEIQDLARTLALGYIHIGFFEEASAIATPRAESGDEHMAVAASLADLGAGAKSRARKSIAPFKNCGPLFELTYAAASPDDDTAGNLSQAHIDALKKMTRALRAPIAEMLALNAVEKGDQTLARIIYDIAKEARDGEHTAALAILEKSLGAAPEEANHTNETLAEIAQTPGPLQSKALAVLAQDYEDRAEVAYEGFLDDLAQQTSKRALSVSEARATFAGAKALAAAGRLPEAVAVLNASAESATQAAPAAKAAAGAIIMNGLLGDEDERLAAVKSFFDYKEFVSGGENADVNIAVARELSKFGATYLVDDALAGLSAGWEAEASAIKARTLVNSDEPKAALDAVAQTQTNAELAAIKVKAYEQLGDRSGVLLTVKSAVRTGAADDAMTRAAWRGEDWSLSMEAFDKTPAKQRTTGSAARISLAALNAGLGSLPAAARETLAQDPELLAAIAHMFAPAPAVSVRAIDALGEYSVGVAKETNFMQRGLGDD